jgi:hypothetical protein
VGFVGQAVDQLELPWPGCMAETGAPFEWANRTEGFEEAFGQLAGGIIAVGIHMSPLLARLIFSVPNYIDAKDRSQGSVPWHGDN